MKFINAENKHLCSDEAIDLLSKMLVYDHVITLYMLGIENNTKGCNKSPIL